MAAAAGEKDASAYYRAGKACTAAWNGNLSYFTSLSTSEHEALHDPGFWMYDPSDETKGRQALVYVQDMKTYTLVPVNQIEPCTHEIRLEPIFYAAANGQTEIIHWLTALCTSRPALRKVIDGPQYVTCVKMEKTLRPAGSAPERAATATATAAVAPAAANSASAAGGEKPKYTLLLEGSASKPVTPLQVAILNGHNEIAMLLQLDSPGSCRGCEAGDCTVM